MDIIENRVTNKKETKKQLSSLSQTESMFSPFDVFNKGKTRQEMKHRYEYEMWLRHELIKDSESYFEINVTKGIVEEYQSIYTNQDEDVEINLQDGEEFINRILSFVVKEDRELVTNAISIEGLRNCYQSGQLKTTLEYRGVRPDGNVYWLEGTSSIMRNPISDEIIAFIYTKNIDKKKKNQIALTSVIEEEIDSVVLLNVKTGISQILKDVKRHGKGILAKELVHETRIMEVMREYNVEEDIERSIRFFKISNMVAELEKKPQIALNYRTHDDKGVITHYRSMAYYLDERHEDIVVTRRNVTEAFEEEQKQKAILQKAVDEANEANHAKTDFLSRMSHDIRTPMNAIIGLTALIREAENQEDITGYLDKIDASSHFLLGLINDILDLTKIESGKIELHEEALSVDDFERQIRTVIQPLMDEKKIDFVIQPGYATKCFMVDKLRYTQIMFNLLSNASKFTPENGKVEFIISRLEDMDGKIGLRHVIRDNGIGMSKEFQRTMFNPFEQERNDITTNQQGTGLGLAIVKNLVDAMQGDIHVDSELGKGTEFTIDIYLEKADEDALTLQNITPDESWLNGLNVLLVEDNEVNILVAQTMLEMKKCNVTVAVNGLAACQMFEQTQSGCFDVILMDITMPVMDGLEATRRIRAMNHPDAKRIPILAMTANAFSRDMKKTKEAGMNAHITKPIDKKILFDTIIQQVSIARNSSK